MIEKKEKPLSQDYIEISGNWDQIDIVSNQPECVNDICAISGSDQIDETHFLSPDNGGCEQKCIFMDHFVSVKCDCDFGYELRHDQKTCVKKWTSLIDGEMKPEKFQHECDFVDESTWDCSSGNQLGCFRLKSRNHHFYNFSMFDDLTRFVLFEHFIHVYLITYFISFQVNVFLSWYIF